MGEDGSDLVFAQDCGQVLGLAGTNDIFNPRGIDLKDVAVEEEDGAQRLTLGGGSDVLLYGKVGEEAIDLVGFELFRMTAGVGEESADPSEVCLFGADGVVADADRGTHAVEEFWCLRR